MVTLTIMGGIIC